MQSVQRPINQLRLFALISAHNRCTVKDAQVALYALLQISTMRTCFDTRLVQDYVGELISIPREIEFVSSDGQNTVKG